MKTVRSVARRALAVLLGLAVLVPLGACAPPVGDNEVVFWTGQWSVIDIAAQQQIVDAFEKANPDLKVRLVPKPGTFTGDATPLITAVRSGRPPDVYLIDRFTVSQQAAVGLLTDLQPFADRTPGLADSYLPFALAEGTYQGRIHALPMDADARGLFYNKDLLAAAGIDASPLDPANGPPTTAEVMAIAKQLDQTDARGNYTRIGFIPWLSQGFHAVWGLSRGAKFFDPDSCQVTPQEPAFRGVFDDFARWADELGYSKVDTFFATYQPPNAPPSQTAFLSGRLGMIIEGDWTVGNIATYKPEFPYGVTYLPVQADGAKAFTPTGGFALVMPKGAHHSEAAWRFMTFMSGEQGQRLYSGKKRLPAYRPLLADKELIKGREFFASMLEFGVSRPPLPVGAAFSDAMDAAQQAVLLGDQTPAEALQTVYDRVQPRMADFCPYSVA